MTALQALRKGKVGSSLQPESLAVQLLRKEKPMQATGRKQKRKGPLTSKLARASPEVPQDNNSYSLPGGGIETELMWFVGHAPRRPDSPSEGESSCIHLR
eukprot:562596-Pelagomonas_calceolata.AAC.1